MPAPPPSHHPFIAARGDIVSALDRVISLHDGATLTGAGIFETMVHEDGRPLFWSRHWKRLQEGAQRMGLPLPGEAKVLETARKLLEANSVNPSSRTRVRLTITLDDTEEPTWFLRSGDIPKAAKSAKMITVPFRRNEFGALKGLKTINYGDNVVATRLVEKAGVDEAIFANTQSEICEGTWSNLFLQVAGELITPPLTSGCLPGVTRDVVIETAAKEGLTITEKTIPISEMGSVETAFLTSSVRQLLSISEIDGRTLPELKTLPTLFAAYREAEISS